jgi:hypothetical protein
MPQNVQTKIEFVAQHDNLTWLYIHLETYQ